MEDFFLKILWNQSIIFWTQKETIWFIRSFVRIKREWKWNYWTSQLWMVPLGSFIDINCWELFITVLRFWWWEPTAIYFPDCTSLKTLWNWMELNCSVALVFILRRYFTYSILLVGNIEICLLYLWL